MMSFEQDPITVIPIMPNMYYQRSLGIYLMFLMHKFLMINGRKNLMRGYPMKLGLDHTLINSEKLVVLCAVLLMNFGKSVEIQDLVILVWIVFTLPETSILLLNLEEIKHYRIMD